MGYFRPADWDDNSKLADGVQRFYDKAKSAQQKRREKWRRSYLYMHCQHDATMFGRAVQAAGRQYPLEAMLFRPLFAQQVYTALPRLRDALLGGDPPFQPVPEIVSGTDKAGQSEAWAEVDLYRQFVNYQLYNEINWPQMIGPLLQEAKADGTAFIRIEHYVRAEPQWQMQPVDGRDGEWKFGQVTYTSPADGQVKPHNEIESRLRATMVPKPNLLIDPRASSLDGKIDVQAARAVAELWNITSEEMVSWIVATPNDGWVYPKDGKFAYLAGVAKRVAENVATPGEVESFTRGLREWLKEWEGTVTADDDFQKKLQVEVNKIGNVPAADDDEDRSLLRILSFWTAAPDPWHLLRIGGDGGAIIKKQRREKHPCLRAPIPYVAFTPLPNPHEVYGMGLIDLLQQLQHETNTWANLLMTGFNEGLHGITVLNGGLGVTAAQLVGQPNRMLTVTNPGREPLSEFVHHIERRIPDVGAYLRMLDDMQNQGNMTGGATEYLQGGSPNLAGGTVRGYALAVEQGSRRWNYEAACLAFGCVRMGEIMHALNQQYVTQATYFQALNKTGPAATMAVDPKIIGRKYRIRFDYRPVVVNEAVQYTNHQQFCTVFGQFPEFNRQRAIVDAAKLLHKPQPDEYVLPQSSDAQLENLFFAQHGAYPWPPQPGDNHGYHSAEHQKMQSVAQAMGPMAQMQWQAHALTHQQFMGMAAAGGPPGMGQQGAPQGPPGQAGMPPGPEQPAFPYDMPGTPTPQQPGVPQYATGM